MKATSSSGEAYEPSIPSSEPATRSLSERGERLARKLKLAESMLVKASPRSRDAQLLGIALLRRDEALLDELISRLTRKR